MFKQPTKELIKYSDYKYLVYARVSSDKDSQKDSVPNQIDICRYWLEQNNYEWSDQSILIDEDKSGTLFLERTAMQLILQKARNREIQMVVFKSIHRLARDLKDALKIKEVLLGHNVRLVTIEEGYDSLHEGKNDMIFEMHSMFAAQYPKTQSVAISAALSAKVRRGHHVGRVPYGYERIDNKLVIKEDEAEVIRQIYKWYNNDGIGFKTITRLLNEGVEDGTILRPRYGGPWQVTTVQRILKNPTFCGTFILNQYSSIKVDGRKKQIRNPKEKWNIFEGHHPAIVSKAEWEKANSKPVVNKKQRIIPWNELRGLLKCGKCNSNMVIIQTSNRRKDGSINRWKYLKCSAYRRAGTAGCKNHEPIQYHEFREFLLKQLIQTGKKISIDFESSIGNHNKQQITRLKANVLEYENKRKGLVDLYLDKLIDKTEFQTKRDEFEDNIKAAQDRIFMLSKEETNEIAIKDIQDAFKSIEKQDQDLFHAFNVLIDHVLVYHNLDTKIKYNFNYK